MSERAHLMDAAAAKLNRRPIGETMAETDADQLAFNEAMAALGLDPKTVPNLRQLRGSPPEAEPVATRVAEVLSELTTEEWSALRRALRSSMVGYRGPVGAVQRRIWGGWLHKIETACPWSRVPRRFGRSANSIRKGAERLALSGTAERVVAMLRGDPAFSPTRMQVLERLAEAAREWRERVEELHAEADRASDQRPRQAPR